MATRMAHRIVRFASSFLLPSFEGPNRRGAIASSTTEESIVGPAWRRVAAFIPLPAIGAQRTKHETAPIHPEDLDSALAKDHAI